MSEINCLARLRTAPFAGADSNESGPIWRWIYSIYGIVSEFGGNHIQGSIVLDLGKLIPWGKPVATQSSNRNRSQRRWAAFSFARAIEMCCATHARTEKVFPSSNDWLFAPGHVGADGLCQSERRRQPDTVQPQHRRAVTLILGAGREGDHQQENVAVAGRARASSGFARTHRQLRRQFAERCASNGPIGPDDCKRTTIGLARSENHTGHELPRTHAQRTSQSAVQRDRQCGGSTQLFRRLHETHRWPQTSQRIERDF
jgi:hypothetical protein